MSASHGTAMTNPALVRAKQKRASTCVEARTPCEIVVAAIPDCVCWRCASALYAACRPKDVALRRHGRLRPERCANR